MRTIMATMLAGGLALAAASFSAPANATPLGGATAIPLATGDAPEVTLVSGGCGPFRHRGFNGFCYPRGGFGGYGFHRRGFGGYGYHRRFFGGRHHFF